MKGINKVFLIGRVGQDPEFRTLPSGENFASFSLATSDRWRDKASGEMRERTEWHRLTCWGRTAEIVKDYVSKGLLLYIEGRLRNNKWQDKDGNERQRTEIDVQELQMLSPKNTSSDQGGGGYSKNQPAPSQPTQSGPPDSMNGPSSELEDDLPF